MPDGILMLSCNIITAVAYLALTSQLLALVRSFKIVNIQEYLYRGKNDKKKSNYRILMSLGLLFPAFIGLCGSTHAFTAIRYIYSDNYMLERTQTVIMVCCAVVSIVTAFVVGRWYPVIADILGRFEINENGDLRHVENYLGEVVELVKESVIVLAEDLKVQRSNVVSKQLFGTTDLVGERITNCIHPEDLFLFNEGVQQVFGSLTLSPITLEYRIVRPVQDSTAYPPCPFPLRTPRVPANSPSSKLSKVYIADEETPHLAGAGREPTLPTTRSPSVSSILPSSIPSSVAAEAAMECVWVESTICKGMRLNKEGDFEYDLKMVTRNIDDRKKLVLSEHKMRESEEQTRMNAAKLRYLSCIAHDLKTPLQSFCYTMDLLLQTALTAEQRDFVQQATVAVDLMKLTISQTMDISKALTGVKLMPRRTTVSLRSIVERVKVIINGYGKQVPVSFEVAKNVCDTIITDEEWLWQMMLNLLTNACKYTDRGSILVRIRTTTEAALGAPARESTIVVVASSSPIQRTLLRFEVIDTGVGVREDKLATLFDAFSQMQDGQVTGTGLGLFSVRTRAEGLGGRCGASQNTLSSTGTGTVIWFGIPYVPDVPIDVHYHVRSQSRADTRSPVGRVPRSPMSAPVIAPPVDEPTVASASELARHTEEYIKSQQLTAMVVDDTMTVRKLMERVLLKMGFVSVECYENGSKGLEAMMAQQVDIVFSDVQMPIMTGPEMVARFRAFEMAALLSGERAERQLVVAVTANGAQVGASGEGSLTGFDEICPKPLSSSDIYQIIHKHL